MEQFIQFDNISIKIASPQIIKSWSKGEIKKAETNLKKDRTHEENARWLKGAICCPMG